MIEALQMQYPKGRPHFKNLLGRRFGRLLAIQFAGTINGHTRWICACRCGSVREVISANLLNGNTQSCGCFAVDAARTANTTHGLYGTSERQAYFGARARCTNPNEASWKYYGGRGIEFRFESLEQFVAVLGPKPTPDHSLDRINGNGHYEPGNVRWATPVEQAQNRRPRANGFKKEK